MADSEYGEVLATWHFPDYVQHNRSRRWYLIVGVIGALSFLFAMLTFNFLFAIILIIIAVILVLQNRRRPQNVTINITEDGLHIGNDFFEYEALKNFWIAYRPPEVKKLYVPFKSTFRPMLVIPLEDENPIEVRKVLLEHLEEDLEREDETTSEALSRLLKL